MIKIGVISDVHNNAVALKAVLKYLEEAGCNEILCCGDIIGIGPDPEETVQLIKSNKKISAVTGNHESYLINETTSLSDKRMSESERLHHIWEHAQLSDDSKQFLKQLPDKRVLKHGAFKIAVIHYCMSEQREYINFTPNPTLSDCEKMFGSEQADIILYGHDHNETYHIKDGKMYINCGSLGCPNQGVGVAKAGIITLDGTQSRFNALQINYDYDAVIERIDFLKYPAFEDIKMIFYGGNMKKNEG